MTSAPSATASVRKSAVTSGTASMFTSTMGASRSPDSRAAAKPAVQPRGEAPSMTITASAGLLAVAPRASATATAVSKRVGPATRSVSGTMAPAASATGADSAASPPTSRRESSPTWARALVVVTLSWSVSLSRTGPPSSAAHPPRASASAKPCVGESADAGKARARNPSLDAARTAIAAAVSSLVAPAVRPTVKPSAISASATAALTAASPPRMRTDVAPMRCSSVSTSSSSASGSVSRRVRVSCRVPEASASAKTVSLASSTSTSCTPRIRWTNPEGLSGVVSWLKSMATSEPPPSPSAGGT